MKDYKKYFIKVIERNFPDRSKSIMTDIDNHFKGISTDISFAATSDNPIDKRLDFSGYFLALIKTLDLQGENFETIRRFSLEVVTEYVRPKNKLQQWLKRLPVKLVNTWIAALVIKSLNKRVSKNSNANGFVAKIITDKQETYGLGYGIDILECGICKLYEKHSYQKFAPILCEVDELTSGFAGLQLVRTGTIALGSKKCDFRFKKNNNR
ncbi:MAG TPA: L-2-amino-thiazoline-4-carboxylic acid hydrolase [Chryseolinea sp.]|nr:L-2-amino-thiazoline-4-carboxylic acid hydrolase [Chryseolinea sp.]